MSSPEIFELVPNLSEGQDLETIARAVAAVERAGAHVLDYASDAIHNRSVITVAGHAHDVLEAAVALAGIAVERIDLTRHSGVHPRMGALDVLPFVPLGSATPSQAVALAHEAGERIWNAYRVPSFYYGDAALAPERILLASVRPDPKGAPDAGSLPFHPTAGAIAIGARDVLVAFNVDLDTGDLMVARRIARSIRERSGGLKTLRALAFRLSDDLVQISLNVTNERATPLYRVVELVRGLAAEHGVSVRRSELIGCIPRAAVLSAALYALGVEDTTV